MLHSQTAMRFLLFNPENDLALASASPHYTPPASALQMAADLCDLPTLWAEDGDVVLHHLAPARARERMAAALQQACAMSEHVEVSPWGWSPLIVRQLAEIGMPAALLPTASQLHAYRRAASRQTAVRLLQRLRQEWTDARVVGESTWCESMAEAEQAVARYGAAMLKAPLSGSGRGVHPVAQPVMPERTRAWAERCLRTQGGVECEPLYERVADMAAEFWHSGTGLCHVAPCTAQGTQSASLKYVGLSLFVTTEGGVYAGNLVCTEQAKRDIVASMLPRGIVEQACLRLQRLLAEEAGIPEWYSGPVGVDMMVVRHGGELCLHPLVEVNMRYTMGYVALCMTARRPVGAAPALWRIELAGGHYRQHMQPMDIATDLAEAFLALQGTKK